VRRTWRTHEEIRTLLGVAAGRRPADLYLEGGTLLNVYSGELYPANVAIAGRRIAYVGRGRAMVGPETRVISVAGKTLVPGYIDPHTHITGMTTPIEFAREVVRGGTTTLVADTLHILLQTPPERTAELLTALSGMPVLILWFLRLHGASHLPEETAFALERLRRLLELDEIRTVGEVTRWPAVYHGDDDLLQKIALALASGRRVEGHAPGASAERLTALAAAGWSSDHEAITPDEVVHRLRAGVYTMLRHSSLRPDLPLLAPAITEDRARSARVMLTADGPEAVTIAERGYMDHVIRQAIASGIAPIPAYQMATLNPAAYYGLDEEIGGIGPGRRADVAVLDDLRNPTPELVLARGDVAARAGECVAAFPTVDWARFFPPRFRPAWDPDPSLFELRARSGAHEAAGGADAGGIDAPEGWSGARFPVIHLENSVITRRVDVPMAARGGLLEPPPGIVRLALVDPQGRWIVRGALANFVTRLGGLASSFNVVAHLMVLGQDPRDMARAARRTMEIGGGIVVVEGGSPVLEIPLPIGGMMTPERLPEIASRARGLYAFLREHGYPHADPHYTLLFLPLDSLPDIRITYRGVWDVRRGKVLVPREDLSQAEHRRA
jgi:adenine deaminase